MSDFVQILVADDEPDIRKILLILLENRGYSVLEAENGNAAVQAVEEHPDMDLVIMDIMMPGMSGTEAVSLLRSKNPVPVLFLTAKTQMQDREEAYAAGGDDYLAKPFSREELLMKVDSLIRRYRVYKGKFTGRVLGGDLVIDTENRRVLRAGEPVDLTDMEYAIVEYLSDHRGTAVSVEEIFEGVWKEAYLPSSNNTVMVHVVNLRKKLEADPSSPKIIRTVWGRGYTID